MVALYCTQTLTIVGGFISVIIFASKRVTEGIKSTQESCVVHFFFLLLLPKAKCLPFFSHRLRAQGLHISEKGISIKTNKRFDRDDYVDATQRSVALSNSVYREIERFSSRFGTPTGVLSRRCPRFRLVVPTPTLRQRAQVQAPSHHALPDVKILVLSSPRTPGRTRKGG